MYGRFLYYILQFRGVMILTMASLLVVSMVLMVLMRDFRWTSKRRLMVITLFFQMPGRYMVYQVGQLYILQGRDHGDHKHELNVVGSQIYHVPSRHL